MSLNKFLSIVLFILFIGIFYTSRLSLPSFLDKSNLTGDAAVCANLSADPSTLPFVSYSTQEGFDECVSRCMTSVMMQVCRQLPDKSNVFATQPKLKEKMLAGCNQNIQDFITHQTRCPYLNCKP